MTIYIRDDDVLVGSSSWDNPFGRFRQVHEWTKKSDKVMHVPTILVTEIQQFPEAIEYIKSETKDDYMQPQLHGLRHVDPGKLSFRKLRDELKEAKEWMFNTLEVMPTKWYTPWGAGDARGQEYIWEAANLENMEMVTCKDINKLNGRYGVVQRIKDGADPLVFLEDKEIFLHWWEGGQRLNRVIHYIEKGEWLD